MIKPCVFDADGNLINIGEWDYGIQKIEVEPAEYDEEGNEIKEAVYEDVVTNPLPDGANIEEREVEYDPDRGWYLVGTVPKPTTEARIAAMESALLSLMGL